jgi:hypothetical protein
LLIQALRRYFASITPIQLRKKNSLNDERELLLASLAHLNSSPKLQQK